MVAILEVMIEDKKLEGRTIGGKSAREVIERRNNRIIKLFKHHGISVRLIGDMEKPAIILDETWCLSCWARNFDLILNDAPRGYYSESKAQELVDELGMENYTTNII